MNLPTLHQWPLILVVTPDFRPELAQVAVDAVELFSEREWELVWERVTLDAERELYERRN